MNEFVEPPFQGTDEETADWVQLLPTNSQVASMLFIRAAEVRDGDGDGYVNDGTPQEQLASEWDRKLKGLRNRRGENKDGVSLAVTETPEFKAWFGDSKVVDENGKPLIVYHGGKTEFREFRDDRVGSSNDFGFAGAGHYFMDDPEWASGYAESDYDESKGHRPNVMPVYLSIQNPLIVDSYEKVKIAAGVDPRRNTAASRSDSFDIQNRLREKGYDGVIVRSTGVSEYVAFEASSIKSATGNSGRFDRESADISKSLFSIATTFKSVDIRDGDGDGLIYDGTHLERAVNTQAKDLIDGQSIVIPESFTYGKIEDAKVESIEDGKIAIYRSYVSGDGTPTKHVLAEGTQKEIKLLLNDLAGVLDHPADSGNPVLDAALSGRAEYLGRGHGGVVFGVGNKVVKASSIVPFHWNNGLRNEKGANDKLIQEAEIIDELKSAGVPGVLPLEVIEHDGRVFAIRDKISLDGIDQQAIDDAGKALQVMHDAGYATHDQIQIGMGSDGKFRFFDVSEATKIDPKSPYAREDMDSDHSSLKRFAEKLGLKHENPRDLYADVKLEKAITDALTYKEGKTDAGGYRDHEMALREALHRMKTMMPDTLSFYEEETKKLIAEMRDGWRAISAAEKAAKAAK